MEDLVCKLTAGERALGRSRVAERGWYSRECSLQRGPGGSRHHSLENSASAGERGDYNNLCLFLFCFVCAFKFMSVFLFYPPRNTQFLTELGKHKHWIAP